MAKQTLSGSLEEQCEFLYNLAVEKMDDGNYTGAVHALKEIVKYAPDYRDSAELLVEAKRRKTAQTSLIVYALVGSALFIGIGTLMQVQNDFVFLLLALTGGLAGYAGGNVLNSMRRQPVVSEMQSHQEPPASKA